MPVSPTPRRRWWLQISLRGLLVVMALVGVGVLKETSGRARSQTFAYQAYMDLLR